MRESEEWRDVVGFEGYYQVSNMGGVRSLHARFRTARPMSLSTDEHGYREVCLCVNSKLSTKGVHRLVAGAFHGDKRNALHCQVAHLDGDRANNRASNLKWVSHAENMSHKRRHGTAGGERHPRARLTEDAVRHIRTRYAKSADIAADYGVSKYAILDVWQRKRWAHVR